MKLGDLALSLLQALELALELGDFAFPLPQAFELHAKL